MYSSRMKRDVGLFVILFLAGVATANILFICLSIAVLLVHRDGAVVEQAGRTSRSCSMT